MKFAEEFELFLESLDEDELLSHFEEKEGEDFDSAGSIKREKDEEV